VIHRAFYAIPSWKRGFTLYLIKLYHGNKRDFLYKTELNMKKYSYTEQRHLFIILALVLPQQITGDVA
jgi:hypothetical protein